jgi:hypothetical protein
MFDMIDDLIDGAIGRVRNPEKRLIKACEQFEEDPKKNGKLLARLGKQEGFEFIEPYVDGLRVISKSEEAKRVADLLTQPKWTFHKTSNRNVMVFGVGKEEFEVLGTYCCAPGPHMGDVKLTSSVKGLTILEAVATPLKGTKVCTVKQKVWRDGRKYFIINGSKSREELLEYYDEDRIEESPRKGFMRQFNYFVREAGPFNNSRQARRARLKIIP